MASSMRVPMSKELSAHLALAGGFISQPQRLYVVSQQIQPAEQVSTRIN